MRRELLVPKLGLTMTEATLVEWLVKPGDSFRTDQSIFVVESEKAANEVPAEADGRLLEITAALGETLEVGSVIGYWDDEPGGGAAAAGEATGSPDAERIVATPYARRLAREREVDVGTVCGSGPGGRIRAADIPQTERSARPAQDSLRVPTATERSVAARLVASKQAVPHFYLAREAEVSALQHARRKLNEAQREHHFTLTHFILLAVGRALVRMPRVNRVWTEDGVLSLAATDVGMAVHSERGLLVPVMRDVGRQTLAQVASAAATAAARAQAGRLGTVDMQGGAITVSNAGMHDVTYMTPIINPGQAMILGVGSVRGVFRPGEREQPTLRRELSLVLSADHRVLDGVTALAFLKHVAGALEQPDSLLEAA